VSGSETAVPVEPLASFAPQRWIADHPIVAERWRSSMAARGIPVDLVPSASMLAHSELAEIGRRRQVPRRVLIVLSVPGGAEVDPAVTVSALCELRAETPGLEATVLGDGLVAEALRRSLEGKGLLAQSVDSLGDHSPSGRWAACLGASVAVAIACDELARDPTAWAAWSLGVPVVRLVAAQPQALVRALRDALHDRRRFEREVRAGAALARRQLCPAGVAVGWLRSYLEAQIQPVPVARAADETTPLPLASRTQLTLVSIEPRALYASWTLRTEDRQTGLDWLGADAVHATLALRLQDITDIAFSGSNAHWSRTIDLGFAERFRTIPIDLPGRSFVGSLGLRSSRGHFHPLAHAGPVHLPREELATHPATRKLRSLPRRQ
jgi:hypothetical protein